MWGCFRTQVASRFPGGFRHVACRRRERVRPIRFDQGIGAIDRETCLSPAPCRGAGVAPRRADAHHRVPDHDLPRRVRAGRRPDAPETAGHPPRHLGARRPARRAYRPPHLRATGAAEEHREPAGAAARSHSILGHRRAATSSSPLPESTAASSPASRSTAIRRATTACSTQSRRRNCWRHRRATATSPT